MAEGRRGLCRAQPVTPGAGILSQRFRRDRRGLHVEPDTRRSTGPSGLKILHLAAARPVRSCSSYVLTTRPARTRRNRAQPVVQPNTIAIGVPAGPGRDRAPGPRSSDFDRGEQVVAHLKARFDQSALPIADSWQPGPHRWKRGFAGDRGNPTQPGNQTGSVKLTRSRRAQRSRLQTMPF